MQSAITPYGASLKTRTFAIFNSGSCNQETGYLKPYEVNIKQQLNDIARSKESPYSGSMHSVEGNQIFSYSITLRITLVRFQIQKLK